MAGSSRLAAAGATSAVAAFACTGPTSPASHRSHLARALVDTLASALAGAGSEPEALLRRYVAKEAGSGPCTVWTSGNAVPPSQAALLNGTAAHALDWDDVSPGAAMHPSAVLIPALAAVGEVTGADGATVTAAYDVGAAVFRAVAAALPRLAHYRRGWHTTATVGRLAGVAGLANLLSMDETPTRTALGLAASFAGGSLANFGTMTKPLHAGLAARDAVMAVQLAADGFTANPSQLEANGGFFAVFGEPAAQDLSRLPDDLNTWRTRWPQDWALKRYPACYATHRAIDAALRLRTEQAGELPEKVEAVVEPGGLVPLIPREPATPTEARFSLAYVLASAFARGPVRMTHFTEAALRDTAVTALMPRISAAESTVPPLGPREWDDGFAVVSATYRDGSVRRARVDHAQGSASAPLSDADLDQKFADGCAAAAFTPAASRDLAAALRSFPAEHDIRTVGALLAQSHAPDGR